MPTVAANKDAKIILTSTPNGLNHWYDIFTDAKEARSNFKHFEINWYDVPGRTKEWLDEQISEQGKMFVNQNYLCEFLGSSATLLDPETLQRFNHKEPERIDEIFKGMKVYNEPEHEHKYVIGVDSSKNAGDNSGIQVLDVSDFPFKLVAAGKININHMKLAEGLYELGHMYNTAFIIIENNEGSGQSTADMLFNVYEYENIYFEPKKKYPGFRTTTKSRRLMLDTMKLLLDNERMLINDFSTIQEFFNFVLINGKYQADEGHHDDMVMALALCMVPFLDIKSFDDAKKFIDAIYSSEAEYDDFAEIISFGGFEDGTKVVQKQQPSFWGFDDNELPQHIRNEML
jgi:hypothetical protein